MIKWLFFLFVCLLSITPSSAQVGIGQTDPNTWDASRYAGADICAKITSAAIAAKALSPNGATIDARNITSGAACAGSLYTGWPTPFPATVVLGPIIPSSIGATPANVNLVYSIPGTGSSSLPNSILNGTIVTTPTVIVATGNLDATTQCGRPVHYNSASAGVITILANTVAPGCHFPIVALGTGLVSVAVAAGGTRVGNVACTANPRTTGQYSTIWVEVLSNAGSAPVVNISGDCG